MSWPSAGCVCLDMAFLARPAPDVRRDLPRILHASRDRFWAVDFDSIGILRVVQFGYDQDSATTALLPPPAGNGRG